MRGKIANNGFKLRDLAPKYRWAHGAYVLHLARGEAQACEVVNDSIRPRKRDQELALLCFVDDGVDPLP